MSDFKFADEIKSAVRGLDSDVRLEILESIIKNKKVSYTGLMKTLQLNDEKKGKLNFHLKILSECALIDRYEDWRRGNEERSFYTLSTFGKDVIDGLLSSVEPKTMFLQYKLAKEDSKVTPWIIHFEKQDVVPLYQLVKEFVQTKLQDVKPEKTLESDKSEIPAITATQ